MGFFQFIRSREARKHWLRILLVNLGLLATLWLFLWWYTGHGEYVSVPDLRGMTLEEAMSTLDERDLAVLVVDSIYNEDNTGGTVWEQSPAPEQQVKEGRQVFLSVYSKIPPQEKINIEVGEYAQVALIKLKNKGIKVKTKFEPNNNLVGSVIRVTHKGKSLKPDDLVARGEEVVVVIGESADARITIPSIIGLTIDSAVIRLEAATLMLGEIYSDIPLSGAQDSASARVCRQVPGFDPDYRVSPGTLVDIHVSTQPCFPDTSSGDNQDTP